MQCISGNYYPRQKVSQSDLFLNSIKLKSHLWIYRDADKSLARPASRCILFDGENISFDASLVLYIYVIYMYIWFYPFISEKKQKKLEECKVRLYIIYNKPTRCNSGSIVFINNGHGIVQCTPTLISIQDLFHPNLWQTPVAAVRVYSAPDDGRKGRLKHVECTCSC